MGIQAGPVCAEHHELIQQTQQTLLHVQKMMTALKINGSGASEYLDDIFDRLRAVEICQARAWALTSFSALVGAVIGGLAVKLIAG